MRMSFSCPLNYSIASEILLHHIYLVNSKTEIAISQSFAFLSLPFNNNSLASLIFPDIYVDPPESG